MTAHEFTLAGVDFIAEPDGSLFAPATRLLCVSDLHLGKSGRIARREGRLTPPYETEETLGRLAEAAARLCPATIICLGDSFDDDRAAAELAESAQTTLAAMMAGRRWIWIAGNHDPAPLGVGGEIRAEHRLGPVAFRHIAAATLEDAAEISGHYHPKTRLRGRGRPSFLIDERRAILPAFGAYTGGLDIASPVFDELMAPGALTLMTGRRIIAAPRAGVAEARDARRDARRTGPMRQGVRPPV